MVARILFLLLLHCSAWPRLDPAQQDLHTFLFPSVCISTLFIGKRHSLQIRLQVLPREVHPRNAAESTPSCVQSQDCILDDYFQMFQSLTLNGTFWMFFFIYLKLGPTNSGWTLRLSDLPMTVEMTLSPVVRWLRRRLLPPPNRTSSPRPPAGSTGKDSSQHDPTLNVQGRADGKFVIWGKVSIMEIWTDLRQMY